MTGLPHKRFTSISITAAPEVASVIPLENVEVEQLTQERLEELWDKFIEMNEDDKRLYELIADKKVVLIDNNEFHIQVPNLYLDSVLHGYQNKILDFFRSATHNEMLKYKAAVVVEKVETRAYLPRDKFDDMASRNPSMLTLRKLFPDIDF